MMTKTTFLHKNYILQLHCNKDIGGCLILLCFSLFSVETSRKATSKEDIYREDLTYTYSVDFDNTKSINLTKEVHFLGTERKKHCEPIRIKMTSLLLSY